MEKLLLSADEVATTLAISTATAYKLIREGTIPSVRVGALVKVRPEALRQYVEGLGRA